VAGGAEGALEHGGAEDPGEPLAARFGTRLVHDGFWEEDGELWSADGRLLAHSRQLALLVQR